MACKWQSQDCTEPHVSEGREKIYIEDPLPLPQGLSLLLSLSVLLEVCESNSTFLDQMGLSNKFYIAYY